MELIIRNDHLVITLVIFLETKKSLFSFGEIINTNVETIGIRNCRPTRNIYIKCFRCIRPHGHLWISKEMETDERFIIACFLHHFIQQDTQIHYIFII